KANSEAMNLGVPNIADVGISRDTNKTIGNSNDYRSNCVEFIGGKLVCLKDFNETAWAKSLEDYNNWDCVEFRNPISVFNFLSGDKQREIYVLLGKKILYSKTETYDCSFDRGIPVTFKLKSDANISKILQNRDADCNIFATVVDDEETNNELFNCQILWPQDYEPKLIIHCIQENFRKHACKLKISWMVIDYDIYFDSLLSDSDVQLKVLKYDFNTKKNQLMLNKILPIKNVPPCIGIPVFNKSENSFIIGHHFYKFQDRNVLFAFAYCLKNKCYVKLPQKFIFYTLFSNAYESLPLKVRKCFFLFNRSPFVDIEELTPKFPNPKYV
ncbi:3451_t:CDS:1, partial [Funneliformis geosporum]